MAMLNNQMVLIILMLVFHGKQQNYQRLLPGIVQHLSGGKNACAMGHKLVDLLLSHHKNHGI